MTGTPPDESTATDTDEIQTEEQPQPNPNQSLDDEDSVSVIEERPLLAGVIIFAVGGVSYAGISFVARNTVDPLETVLFAIAFSVVYTVFAYVAK